jgi:hypothetical protein
MYYDFEIEQELKRLGITKEEALAKGETWVQLKKQ